MKLSEFYTVALFLFGFRDKFINMIIPNLIKIVHYKVASIYFLVVMMFVALI